MARETRIITVDGYKDKDGLKSIDYVVTQFPATKGLEIQFKLMEGSINTDLIKDVITSSVALGSVKMDSKKFDDHFANKYTHLMKLYDEVLGFNFDENFTENGTSEE